MFAKELELIERQAQRHVMLDEEVPLAPHKMPVATTMTTTTSAVMSCVCVVFRRNNKHRLSQTHRRTDSAIAEAAAAIGATNDERQESV